MICVLCEETIADDDNSAAVGLTMAHRECLLRETMGGIGHLLDHIHWCIQLHDPDGGMTYRQSALAVDHWVHQKARRGA